MKLKCLVLFVVFAAVGSVRAQSVRVDLRNTTWEISTCVCSATDKEWTRAGTITFKSDNKTDVPEEIWGLWKAGKNKDDGHVIVVYSHTQRPREFKAILKDNTMEGIYYFEPNTRRKLRMRAKRL